jgi:hypothetical protein
MGLSSPHTIKLRFHAIFRTAPVLYDEMLLEFERFEEDCLRSIYQADNSSILQAQGVAKQTSYILTLLQESKNYAPPQPTPPAP